MALFAHESVLADEALGLLAPRPGGRYCDATLGGGGHAERILEASAPGGQLVGVDRDPEALEAARVRLERFGDRITLVHSTFAEVGAVLRALGAVPIDGFLLDVGVSSPQLDVAERGFSFSKEGPLDMRMDPSQGETAFELLRRVDPDELARILREYGEERYARRIARAIKEAVEQGEAVTTTALAAVVSRAIPARDREQRIHPATRTFQALRIAVNDELGELERFLDAVPALVAAGGRIVVITFHSLEDRIVKQRFRGWCRHHGLPADVAAGLGLPAGPPFSDLTRRPVTAGEAELGRNPRARSAKLRAVERRA